MSSEVLTIDILLRDEDTRCVYIKGFLPTADQDFIDIRNTAPWAEEYVTVANRLCKVRRLTCFYGDKGTELQYSGNTGKPTPWSEPMLRVKKQVEDSTGTTYNFCAVSLYRNGLDRLTMHSDKLKSLVEGEPIASISLGCTRDFAIKPRKGAVKKGIVSDIKRMVIPLGHGDLLVMVGNMQRKYYHGVPERKRLQPSIVNGVPTLERINLTFRVVKVVD